MILKFMKQIEKKYSQEFLDRLEGKRLTSHYTDENERKKGNRNDSVLIEDLASNEKRRIKVKKFKKKS